MSVSYSVQSFTRTRPAVISSELCAGLLVEVARKILGRRIQLFVERLQIVDHLVIEVVDSGTHHLLQQLEVEQKSGLVQLFCRSA